MRNQILTPIWTPNAPGPCATRAFPVEVNTATKEELLRVPGIGPKSALRILQARRVQNLGMAELKRIGVVLKRAQYFITCRGKAAARQPRRDCQCAAGPQGVQRGNPAAFAG